MNALDILGSLLKGGMGSSGGRLDRTVSNKGFGAPGGMYGGGGMQGGSPGGGGSIIDMLGKLAGGAQGGSPRGGGSIIDVLGKLAGGTQGGAPGAGRSSSSGGFSTGDLLGSLGKVVLGGSGGSGTSSMGAGANTIFGALAAQALAMAKNMMSGDQSAAGSQSLDVDDATAVIAGLRKPANTREEQQVRDVATLTVQAMINAAKADGRIDAQETERLVGKMREDGVTDEEQRFVMEEMRKPMDTDAIVRAVPNQQVAAQIYAASLMAIEVDTDVEKRYMQEFADKLGLSQPVLAYMHQAVGLA
jgi:uncharacterized membrane protein YebE (DUF533 family)